MFGWDKGDDVDGRAAISVPVTIDGASYFFMLDTGSDVSMLWGDVAGHDGDSYFHPGVMAIGSTELHDPLVMINRAMKPEYGTEQGTFGLQSMIGRVAVIDYPDREFCLFEKADVPDAIRAAQWSDAVLRGSKLLLPVSIGNFQLRNVMFDSGSSQFPLYVDLVNWRRLTGIDDPDAAPLHGYVNSWGQRGALYGAPMEGVEMTIGGASLDAPVIYTQPGKPDELAEAFQAGGIVGNVPFWNGIVVLDLSNALTSDNKLLFAVQLSLRWQQNVRFGVIK